MIKLKNLIFEASDLPPPEPPAVKFVLPSKNPASSPPIYTDKSANISDAGSNPTFDDYKKHFIKYEGKKNKPYIDSRGYSTVGIGHKFEKGESKKSTYSDVEIDNLFKKDLAEAISSTKKVFPNFDTLPKEVKIKLVSLTFNLGEGGIKEFKKFRSAISNRNWDVAGDELMDSKWYNQVKNRGKDYVQFFKSLA